MKVKQVQQVSHSAAHQVFVISVKFTPPYPAHPPGPPPPATRALLRQKHWRSPDEGLTAPPGCQGPALQAEAGEQDAEVTSGLISPQWRPPLLESLNFRAVYYCVMYHCRAVCRCCEVNQHVPKHHCRAACCVLRRYRVICRALHQCPAAVAREQQEGASVSGAAPSHLEAAAVRAHAQHQGQTTPVTTKCYTMGCARTVKKVARLSQRGMCTFVMA